ncbi:MAG: hypothetical protein ACXAEN_27220 [Candidatus Thorarchaeota archaeon]|jgi:hypothetical protein
MKAAARRYEETNNMLFTDFVAWTKWKTENGEWSFEFSRSVLFLISKFLGELREIHEGTYTPSLEGEQ